MEDDDKDLPINSASWVIEIMTIIYNTPGSKHDGGGVRKTVHVTGGSRDRK